MTDCHQNDECAPDSLLNVFVSVASYEHSAKFVVGSLVCLAQTNEKISTLCPVGNREKVLEHPHSHIWMAAWQPVVFPIFDLNFFLRHLNRHSLISKNHDLERKKTIRLEFNSMRHHQICDVIYLVWLLSGMLGGGINALS